jgi:hypothetical protein
MSFLGKLVQVRAELDTRHDDPWRKTVEAAVRGKEAISTAAILDAVRAPASTGTARRVAAIMRDLHFVPIKSRRLMPGGRAGNTVTRGWAPNGQQGPFRVTADLAPDWESGDVAVVQSLDDAIPALAAYYERNPPRWQRETAARHVKFTQFALLRVEQDEGGHWLVKRDDYQLLHNGEPAAFATHGQAQHAADAHLLDYYPGIETIDDGLSWIPDPEIDWRSCPHRVEARAYFEQVTSALAA